MIMTHMQPSAENSKHESIIQSIGTWILFDLLGKRRRISFNTFHDS